MEEPRCRICGEEVTKARMVEELARWDHSKGHVISKEDGWRAVARHQGVDEERWREVAKRRIWGNR